jgi:hypothetical protein
MNLSNETQPLRLARASPDCYLNFPHPIHSVNSLLLLRCWDPTKLRCS